MTSHDLLALLTRRPDPAEHAAICAAACRVERRLEALSSSTARIDAGALAKGRLGASGALSRAPAAGALEAWRAGNELVLHLASVGAPLDLDTLCRLNGVLRGKGAAELRTTEAFMGGRACPEPDALPLLLAPMRVAVDERTQDVHPLAGAALLQQWILSVHPFADANGRTARLAVDWQLAIHGYPPPVYRDPLDAMNAVVDHGRAPISVLEAVLVVVRGVERTLDLAVASD